MTQTQSAPPADWSPPAQQPATPAVQPPGARRASAQSPIKAWFEGTPGRMRALLILAAVMSVVFGAAAAQGFSQSEGALTRAEANAAQLVRIQAIHTNLVSANADATNAFLVGGLEPPEQRQHFVDSMAEAARLIAEAATAQPADKDALGALNQTLITYDGLIEQARANNRQGLPIGSQYLKDANALLQNDSLPLVKALVQANEERVGTEFDGVGNGNIWLLTGGLLTLVVFGFTLRWLARRTHRYINLPIAAGAVLVLLTTLIGGFALAGASSDAADTHQGAYDQTLALSRARIAAYDARSNESLTLIARGSGDAYEQAYQESARVVDDQLSKVDGVGATLEQQWKDYKEIHAGIRTTDTGGNWEKAVDMAIGRDPQVSSVKAFSAFDENSATQLKSTSGEVHTELISARDGLPPIGWLGLPIGIAAALLAAWGMSQRLGEYR
ncbi:hypothetical protein EV646_104509 [Kribbella antiqua]|uniref:Secreted protein n=1 Tax=Kribbella antiqua TaxID=2512217 RepID=A0A4R2IUE3_9ACTN|nr:hypothetical protein [Kribbella antiqua]TCO48687.1 hypothetical protein EV646_104509 [Kribbella antiqua]